MSNIWGLRRAEKKNVSVKSKRAFEILSKRHMPKRLKTIIKLAKYIMAENQAITEGLASVKTAGKVFYNPVQEFNRDLRLVKKCIIVFLPFILVYLLA